MIRLASWNIRLGIQQGLEPIARALREFDADIVALQEVGRFWVMGPDGHTTGELARMAGYEHAEFVPSLSWYPPAQYGHALLSRHPIETPRIVRLPQQRDEERTLLEARIALPDGPCNLVSTHLSHVDDRPAQGALLHRRARELSELAPLIVMGDLNQADTTESWMAGLLEVVRPAPVENPTFPASAPLHQIDWILSSFGQWRDAQTPETGDLSDHLPVVATLDF